MRENLKNKKVDHGISNGMPKIYAEPCRSEIAKKR